MKINVSACGMNSMMFQKDVFLIPYYLAKVYGAEVSFIYPQTPENMDFPSEFKGVKFIPLRYRSNDQNFSFRGEWFFFWYVLRHAKEYDVLMRFHFSYQTALLGIIFKILNPKGLFYIKADGYGSFAALFRDERKFFVRWKNLLISRFLNHMCSIADRISVETPSLYDYFIRNKGVMERPSKLVLMLNGFDEDLFKDLKMKERTFEEKENIILASGRIGSKDKNVELLMEVATKLYFKNWKIVFVGPIETKECDFQAKIDYYYLKYPTLKSKVIFTGGIYDRKEYWEWFIRSKVFVHMAPVESYGIVFTEAYRFKNYIVSPDVGIAKELIKRSMGEIYPSNDAISLKIILQDIIDGKTLLNNVYKSNNYSISWSNEIQKLNL